jgi:dihydroneopterin aldolase
MDCIVIEGLELDCIVGVRPYERRRPQRVRLDLSLGLDLGPAARSGRIVQTCDYDRVTVQVLALLRFREYRLIEAATEELAAMLFAVYPHLLEIEIRLDKPTALRGRAYSTGVRVTRRREQFPLRYESLGAAERATLLETDEAGLYLVRLQPGTPCMVPEGFTARVLAWSLVGEASDGERRLTAGDPIPAPRAALPPYLASGPGPATLFCCTCPPWPRG